jgi:hypothetical protein
MVLILLELFDFFPSRGVLMEAMSPSGIRRKIAGQVLKSGNRQHTRLVDKNQAQ